MPNPSPFSRPIGSHRVDGMRESVIREMTREAHKHGAINLSQGIPDEDETPATVKQAAKDAIDTSSQYTITWGLPELRDAVAGRYEEWKGVRYDPETEVTVTTGTSEAVVATLLALCDPGDGVIYFEPTYESYIPAAQFAGGRLMPLDITDGLEIDPDALREAATDASILILNHPHNPTGNVFTRDELELVAAVAAAEDLIVVTDEIYEHIVYTDDYVSPVEIDGLADRTVVCTGLSKTYSVTGWRVGFALAPEPLSAELRKVHDYTSICAPTPFQKAGVEALSLPEDYYSALSASYERRRDLLYDGLQNVGLDPVKPDGAYYMLTRYPGAEDDTEFALRLIREAGVAVVPGSSFYTEGSAEWVRFTFSRNEATIEEALGRLNTNRFW
ncbi:pyridoxal phosphate-dependent aminotransferase [Haloferax sp. DFSO52]|uniref:pyridoxal phosphate-dependent aminotransferase n=1 Tax=Haloferax sp. DFSO52 TaxID=3388505 RepID=UPI003A8623F7